MNWQHALKSLNYAHGLPTATGTLKGQFSDFIVEEELGIEPSGEGEHWWLHVRKSGKGTIELAESLARFARVSVRDIGFSGMKDKQAVTSQWFSVWKPKGDAPNWAEFDEPNIEILRVEKGNRKIKRATHRANRFEIRITNIEEADSLESRLSSIAESGVPNYFGAQRFGFDGDNLRQLRQYSLPDQKLPNKKWSKVGRNKRSMLLSVGRAWLFNTILSERVRLGIWDRFAEQDIANLNGSNSWFVVDSPVDEKQRLLAKDIHPTAPLWGTRDTSLQAKLKQVQALDEFELSTIEPYVDMAQFLESKQLNFQRRATRLMPQELQWDFQEDVLRLRFGLQAGQYATSVVREIVTT